LDFMNKKKMVNAAYTKTIDACGSALKKAGKTKPKDHSEILKHFKIHFIDTGLVSKDHIETLKKMHNNKKAFDSGKVSDISEDEIYSSNVYATNLQKAIGDVKIDGGKKGKSPERQKGKK
ncbi:MAG: hypothetical protein KAI18_04190, partial [Candidatus Aenigmarchaeota archaeon]|nr:hypothetical protein [Candidatus Aenigmarchaeota archaeon]